MYLVTEYIENNEGGFEIDHIWIYRNLDTAKAFVETLETPDASLLSYLEWWQSSLENEPLVLEYRSVTKYVDRRGNPQRAYSIIATVETIDFED